jgi:hypothetical protein
MLLILRLVVFIRTAICAFCRKEKYQLLSLFFAKDRFDIQENQADFFR